MKEKILECFERLQDLDIKASLPNMEKLVQTLYDLRDIYNAIGGDTDGGPEADLQKRDGR